MNKKNLVQVLHNRQDIILYIKNMCFTTLIPSFAVLIYLFFIFVDNIYGMSQHEIILRHFATIALCVITLKIFFTLPIKHTLKELKKKNEDLKRFMKIIPIFLIIVLMLLLTTSNFLIMWFSACFILPFFTAYLTAALYKK